MLLDLRHPAFDRENLLLFQPSVQRRFFFGRDKQERDGIVLLEDLQMNDRAIERLELHGHRTLHEVPD
jgi:hypothetical protein